MYRYGDISNINYNGPNVYISTYIYLCVAKTPQILQCSLLLFKGVEGDLHKIHRVDARLGIEHCLNILCQFTNFTYLLT